jgi:hypothetical protein
MICCQPIHLLCQNKLSNCSLQFSHLPPFLSTNRFFYIWFFSKLLQLDHACLCFHSWISTTTRPPPELFIFSHQFSFLIYQHDISKSKVLSLNSDRHDLLKKIVANFYSTFVSKSTRKEIQNVSTIKFWQQDGWWREASGLCWWSPDLPYRRLLAASMAHATSPSAFRRWIYIMVVVDR